MSASEAEKTVIAAARELVAAYNGSGSHYQQIRAVEVALHRIDAANAEEREPVCTGCEDRIADSAYHSCVPGEPGSETNAPQKMGRAAPSPPAGVSEERVREIVKDELTPYYSSEITKAQAEIMVKIARSVLIRLQHTPDEILVNSAQGRPKVGLLFALREIGSRLIALEAASKSREPENLIQSWNREDAEIRAAVRKEVIEECIAECSSVKADYANGGQGRESLGAHASMMRLRSLLEKPSAAPARTQAAAAHPWKAIVGNVFERHVGEGVRQSALGAPAFWDGVPIVEIRDCLIDHRNDGIHINSKESRERIRKEAIEECAERIQIGTDVRPDSAFYRMYRIEIAGVPVGDFFPVNRRDAAIARRDELRKALKGPEA